MKLLFQQILLTVLISYTIATPAPTIRNTRRTAPAQSPISCTYAASQENPNAACWNQLDLTGYLDGWNKTTPTCSSDSSNDSDCCHKGEVWASCFLRLATGTHDLCGTGSLTDAQPCYTKSRGLRSSLDPKIVDRVGYVLQTILNINVFLSDYSKTLLDSTIDFLVNFILTSNLLDNIDPSGRTVVNSVNVVDALNLGLPFLDSPSILPPSNLTDQTLLASRYLSTGLISSPAVALALFLPSKPSNTTLPTIQLSRETFQDSPARLATALALLMTDLPTFVSFASNGSFSDTSFILGLRDSKPHVTLALSTHIVSDSLRQHDWFGVPLKTATTQADFAATCGDAVPPVYGANTTVCQTPAGEATFWSPITHRIYALRYQGKKENQKLSPIDMLKNIQNSTAAALVSTSLGETTTVDSAVVDMPTLFDGAYNCTAQGRAAGRIVNVDAGGGSGGGGTGVLDMSCLSRLPIYLPCKTVCPTSVLVGGACPFGYTGKGC